MEKLIELLSYMTPEEQKQYLGLGTLDERSGLVQQQLKQAQDFMAPQAGQHSTLGGAIGAGLGDVLRGGVGGFQQAQQNKAAAGILDQKDAGRSLYADILKRMAGGKAPAPAASPALGMGDFVPFGFGGGRVA